MTGVWHLYGNASVDRETEERLRNSETLYHSLVETLPQNIFRKDLSERFTFANQRLAYDELPDATKGKIDGLVVRHHYGNRDNLDEASRTAASTLNDDQKARMHWVRHPLVRKHPHTARKSLYAVSGSSFGIEGLGDNEGRALLDDLKAHATAEKYLSTPKYKPGDVVIWDNCALLHSAPLVDANDPRTLWRITVKEQRPTL